APARTTAAAEAPDGSLWVGQTSGAIQIKLRQGVAVAYGRESGLENPWITAIAVDSENRVWAGTPSGLYRSVSAGGKIRFEHQEMASKGRPDLIQASLIDRRGRLWVGTWNGLLRLEAGRWTRFTTSDGLLHNRVARLAEGNDGALWIGYGEPVGVSRLVGGGDHLRWRRFSRK